jgi:hypothetical protein
MAATDGVPTQTDQTIYRNHAAKKHPIDAVKLVNARQKTDRKTILMGFQIKYCIANLTTTR